LVINSKRYCDEREKSIESGRVSEKKTGY